MYYFLGHSICCRCRMCRCANIRLELSSIDEPQNAGKKKRARSLRVIEARMAFADTELKVSAIDVATGQLVNAAIDFFNA